MKGMLLFLIVLVFCVLPTGCSEDSPVEPQIEISRDDFRSAPTEHFTYDGSMMTMSAGYMPRGNPETSKRILVVGVLVFEQPGVELGLDLRVDHLWLVTGAHFRFLEPRDIHGAVDVTSCLYWTPIEYQTGTSLDPETGVYDKDGGLIFVRPPEHILREFPASGKEEEW
ncbi:MAG: hypothetical protein JSW58_04630 [Candidatus Latescibacterota bacterium]|nr:MAG: hypothetical protein JSW58_04630 [Candidatus Latescibacterota bacterium]